MSLPVPRIEDPWQQRKPVFIGLGIIGILLGILWIWGGIITGQSHPAHILRGIHALHHPEPPEKPATSSAPAAPPVITLYGKVVDEAGAPIPDAEVRIEFRNPWQNSERRTTSGSGTFSIHGYRAGIVQVEVKKPGYSNVQLPSEGGVVSTADLDFQSDPALAARHASGATPLVLTLWQPPHLVTSTPNKIQSFSTKLDPTGVPHIIKVGTHPIDIRYENHKRPSGSKNPYSWNLAIAVPGGAIVEKDPAQVKPEAPATGYFSGISIDYLGTLPPADWKRRLHRHYYIRFPDNTHGVLTLRLNADAHTLQGHVIHNTTPGDRDLSHPFPP